MVLVQGDGSTMGANDGEDVEPLARLEKVGSFWMDVTDTCGNGRRVCIAVTMLVAVT